MMKHIKRMSKAPARAADIPTSVKVDFVVAILQAFEPILTAKFPDQS